MHNSACKQEYRSHGTIIIYHNQFYAFHKLRNVDERKCKNANNIKKKKKMKPKKFAPEKVYEETTPVGAYHASKLNNK